MTCTPTLYKQGSQAVLKDRVIQILQDAGRLLQKATTVQQAKLIADVAAAQQVYAKRQQLGAEVESYAYGLKIEALTRLGELLAALPKNIGVIARVKKGMTRGSSGVPRVAEPPTYADLGIGKKEAAVAQQLAALPAETRAAIARQEVSLTEVQRQQRRARQVRTAQLPTGKFRILYADPPWSYGNSVNRDDDRYLPLPAPESTGKAGGDDR